MTKGSIILLFCVGLAGLSALWGSTRGRPPAPLPGLTIELLNGCGEDGLAARASQSLAALGQDVVAVTDAPHHNFERSVLIDRRGRPSLARRLGARLGPVLVIEERLENPPADMTLILGRDNANLALWTAP